MVENGQADIRTSATEHFSDMHATMSLLRILSRLDKK
jgi:hypothetical protein